MNIFYLYVLEQLNIPAGDKSFGRDLNVLCMYNCSRDQAQETAVMLKIEISQHDILGS